MRPFSLKMAWREALGSWRQFIFFFICIAIGVGGIVAVGLLAANVEHAILGDARGLLGGDLQIKLAHPLSAAGQEVLDSLKKRGIAVTHVRELVGMAATHAPGIPESHEGQATQLVELKAVAEEYPFYGTVRVHPPQRLHSLLTLPDSACARPPCWGAVVQESFLIRMGVQVGDTVKIGQAWFTITGLLLKEPDRVVNAFSLGPRVIIAHPGLMAADLVKRGSRIRERYLLRVPSTQSIGPLHGELQGRLAKEGARVSTYRDAQPRVRRFLDQLSTYIGLIGLTSLFVGGIGVACTIQGFLKQKMSTIAILKTVGATSTVVLRIYLTQSLLMGLIGSLVGLGLGVGIQMVLPIFFEGVLPFHLTNQVSVGPLVKGLVLGILATALFTLWPLLAIRTIPPALVFRREIDPGRPDVDSGSPWHRLKDFVSIQLGDRLRVTTGLIIGGGLAGLAMWQARSVTLGLLFMAAFLVALILLQGGATFLLYLVSRMTPPRAFVVRRALSHIQQPGNHIRAIAVSIGVGVMVVVTIAIVKTSLLTTIGERIPDDAPTFFFIDIQPDQKEDFERIIQRETPQSAYNLTPVVRTRLAAINSQRIDPKTYRGKRNGWYFTREYVITARPDLPKDNEIVEGAWWPTTQDTLNRTNSSPSSDTIFVSIEDEAAKNLGVKLGSTLEFDVQGTPLPTEVQSTRKVDWGSFAMNFFMILSPDSLEGAPFTYIASAKVDQGKEVTLQQNMVKALPNVTAINVRDVLQNVANLLKQLAWAIQGMAILCMVSGAIVMTAALSTTRYRRLYEAAILKALGTTRTVIVQSFAMEFAMVGAMAGLIGVGLASVLSWAILKYFLTLPWTFQPDILAAGFVLTMILAIAVGFLSTYRILGEPPLAVLRQE